MLELLTSWGPLALSAVALILAFKPPQQRKVLELRGRVEDLEFAVEETSKRITKRARTEGMEQARVAHEDRRQRQDRIEAEALALINAKKAGEQGELLAGPDDAAKRALRARLLSH